LYESDKLIMEFGLLNNREDEILIQIAKEINNKKILKVIDIPDDVEYDIIENECCMSEYIAEKHRVWS